MDYEEYISVCNLSTNNIAYSLFNSVSFKYLGSVEMFRLEKLQYFPYERSRNGNTSKFSYGECQ